MPSKTEYERLFLLEFFVDYVTVSNSLTYFDSEGDTLCVSFQFLHFPVMRVCEGDVKPQTNSEAGEDSKVTFKTGKSCLFAVHPDENNKISSKFNLLIAVCRKKKECTERSIIGHAAVNLEESFLNLLQSPNAEPIKPTDKNVLYQYDLFPLKDKWKRVVGSVAAFARLSHCGKMIITQFQLAAEDTMDYMFKGTDQTRLFKNDPMMDFPVIEKDEPRLSEKPKPKPKSISKSGTKCKETKRYDSSSSSFSSSTSSSSGDESDEDFSQLSSSIPAVEKKDRGDGELEEDDESYKEIDAEINGHSITIRVVKNKHPKIEIPPEPSCPSVEPPVCPYAPKLNVCDCDYPLPPELTPRCPPQCCSAPLTLNSPLPSSHSFGKLQSSQVSAVNETTVSPSQDQVNTQSAQFCPREDCPLGLYVPTPPPDPMDLEPGCVALKGDQVFFQMSNRPAGEPVNEKEQKLAGSVYYTIGATEAGKETMRNVVQITPQSPQGPLCEGESGPVSGIPLDSKQDMFLLKVMQQNDSVSAKCKLEMELRTPKEKEIKPPSNTIDTQYLETDFPPPEKKGKGKGAAGKKGKKGKK